MDLILVEEDLVPLTSFFAKDVFIDYYTNLIGKEQAIYMADKFLSEQSIQNLVNNGAIFKLVLDNNEPVGFIEYIKEKDRVFLSKLYVRKDKRNKGIGKMMLEDCIEYTKNNKLNKIYLTVNKGNSQTIKKYDHLGFKQIDAVVNDIGNGYVMDDYILQLDL